MVVEIIGSVSKNSGGTAKFMADLLSCLPDYCANLSLLGGTLGESDDYAIDSRVVTRKILCKRLQYLTGSRFNQKLEELGAPNRIKLLHTHGFWCRCIYDTSRYAIRHDIPFVVSPHGMAEPWALNFKKYRKKFIYKLIFKSCYERATAFHACSDQEAHSIRSLGFKQPIAVIPNGVKTEDQKIVLAAPKEKVLSVDDRRTALFLSRIHPKKGLPMLLEAWRRLMPNGWRLILAGNDETGHSLEIQGLIKQFELESQVSLVGPLFGDQKDQAYRDADLFVLPSYSENFGIVVPEALSYQVPVLTTTGCPWEELETHGCGWWVEPIVDGIERGLRDAFGRDPAELRSMGVRGRKLVEEKYQWPSIAEKMSTFYDWILNGGPAPDFIYKD